MSATTTQIVLFVNNGELILRWCKAAKLWSGLEKFSAIAPTVLEVEKEIGAKIQSLQFACEVKLFEENRNHLVDTSMVLLAKIEQDYRRKLRRADSLSRERVEEKHLMIWRLIREGGITSLHFVRDSKNPKPSLFSVV